MNALLKSNFLKSIFFLILIHLNNKTFCQNEITLSKGEKVKSENNLYGIYYNKQWVLPCKYEKLEAYAYKYLFAYTPTHVDIYQNNFNKKIIQENLPIQYVHIYKSFANTDITPIYNSGKFGYTSKFYNISAQYDSLFVICTEGSATYEADWSCDDVIGVIKNGILGVIDHSGTDLIMYPDYVNFRARFTGGSYGKHEIVAMHKTGVEVIFDMLRPENNNFLSTTHNNLKGYVINGQFVEPKYTAINNVYLQGVADYECILPDGTIEYRKGAILVENEKVAAYKENFAREEKLKKEKAEASKLAKEFADKTGLTVEIKTKSYILNVYPGWEGIFANMEKDDWLTGDFIGQDKAAKIFNEGPNGWLKDQMFVNPINIMLQTEENYSLDQVKKDFIDLAVIRSKLPKDKIKPIEEHIVLQDGSKAILLFYVCIDGAGMVGGNYVDCKLAFESKDASNSVTSYTIFMDGGADDLPADQAQAWKDYFKNVLLSIRPK